MFIWDSADYKSSTPGCIFTLSTLSVCGCIVCMWRRKGRKKTDVCVGGRWHQRSFQGHIHTLLCTSLLRLPQAAATDRSHHHPSPSAVTTGSSKCHPQGPKDDCWHVIGSTRQARLLCSSEAFRKADFHSYVSRGRGDVCMAGPVGDLSYVS